MMIVAGYKTNKGVAITNSEFDGKSTYSTSCDGQHYWGLYLTGENDLITFKGNYIHHTSGRSPKIDKGTVLHAANNYWSNNSGHAFEGDSSTYVLIEGSTFDNVAACEQGFNGNVFAPTTVAGACSSTMGRTCPKNSYKSSGKQLKDRNGQASLNKLKGLTLVAADADASKVPSTAGVGKL